MEIGVSAVDLDGLVPSNRLQAKLGLPVEFDEGRLVPRIHEPKRMDAKTFHETKRSGNRTVRHHPHNHVHALGGEADEIPEIVVRRLGLRKRAIWLFLNRMD